MAAHARMIAGSLIVAMGSLGIVFADFCQERDGQYLGDLNLDGIIDFEDVRRFARYDLRQARRLVPGPQAADIDLNGRINGGDLKLLIQGAQHRQGLALDLKQAGACSYSYPYPYPDPGSGGSPLPGARVEARLEGRVVSRTMTDDLGHAYLLLPPGTFDIVIYPPGSGIDATLTALQVLAELKTIQPLPYVTGFAPGEVMVEYDAAYGLDRTLEILASFGVTSWELIYPGVPWIIAFLPDCLHVMEAIEIWKTYPEILHAEPNQVFCLP